MKKIIAALVIASHCTFSFAHGGGLDANDCHKENSTGTYHCHPQGSSSSNSSNSSSASTGVAIVTVLGVIVVLSWLFGNKKSENKSDAATSQENDENKVTIIPYAKPEGLGVAFAYNF
jgi:hypothetical protein